MNSFLLMYHVKDFFVLTKQDHTLFWALLLLVCTDRLQATLGNVVKVYLPYCLGLVNTASQPVKCQHPFFYLSDKALCAGSEPSSQSIQKVRERRGGEFVSPQGEAEWDGILQTLSSAEERLSLWNTAFNLRLRVLCGACDVRERKKNTLKERKGVKNNVCIPGNPSHAFQLVNRLNPGKSFTLQGHVCFLYLSIFHPSCLTCLWPTTLPSTEWLSV